MITKQTLTFVRFLEEDFSCALLKSFSELKFTNSRIQFYKIKSTEA